MVKITKVYTRTGDQGDTHLAGGGRVRKTDPRIVAVGSLDELNAQLGWATEALRHVSSCKALVGQCERIQRALFDLGAQVVVPQDKRRDDTPCVDASMIAVLEQEMDEMNQSLDALKSFILPGGGEAACRFHIARTVCRRAERDLLADGVADGLVLAYINRLSDWLFVTARFITMKTGEAELLWDD